MINRDTCEKLFALATDAGASDEERRNAAILVCAFLKESRHFQNSRAAAALIVTVARWFVANRQTIERATGRPVPEGWLRAAE